jgi:hypothetical protein
VSDQGSRDWDDLLASRALGVLSPTEAAQIDALAAASRETHQELQALRAAANRWPDSLPAPPPSPDGRLRLLALLDGPERFRPFFATLKAQFHFDEPALLPLLAKLTDDRAWTAPAPGFRYFDFVPSPTLGLPEGGFIRLAPNTFFPRHRHLGREIGVVLQGSLLLDGRTFHAGDIVEAGEGSAHSFSSGPGRDLILMVAHGGLAFEF